MKRSEISEVQVAAAVVAWLQDMKWDVYQEVSLGVSHPTIDIVAIRGPVVWAIECKVNMGMAVLEQAAAHLRHAHYVSVACHGSKGREGFTRHILRLLGIGLFDVKSQYRPGKSIETVWVAERFIEPALHRQIEPITTYGAMSLYRKMRPKEDRGRDKYPMLRDLLTEGQKNYAAAGNDMGQRWSPWKHTCQAVLEYVVAHPGCSASECLKNVKHHYQTEATARGSMVTWVREGKVDGVEERRNGRLIEWWPTEAAFVMRNKTIR